VLDLNKNAGKKVNFLLLTCALGYFIFYEMHEMLFHNESQSASRIRFALLCIIQVGLFIRNGRTKENVNKYTFAFFWLTIVGIAYQNDLKMILLDCFSFFPFLLGWTTNQKAFSVIRNLLLVEVCVGCGLLLYNRQEILSQTVRNLHEFTFTNFSSTALLLSPLLLILQKTSKISLVKYLFVPLNILSLYCNILLGNRLGSGLVLTGLIAFLMLNFRRNLVYVITITFFAILFVFQCSGNNTFTKIVNRSDDGRFQEALKSNERFDEFELAWKELTPVEKLFGKGFGGTVFRDAPVYIERRVDGTVYKAHSMYVVMHDGETNFGKLILHSLFATLVIKGGLFLTIITITILILRCFSKIQSGQIIANLWPYSNSVLVLLFIGASFYGLSFNYSAPFFTFAIGYTFRSHLSGFKALEKRQTNLPTVT